MHVHVHIYKHNLNYCYKYLIIQVDCPIGQKYQLIKFLKSNLINNIHSLLDNRHVLLSGSGELVDGVDG